MRDQLPLPFQAPGEICPSFPFRHTQKIVLSLLSGTRKFYFIFILPGTWRSLSLLFFRPPGEVCQSLFLGKSGFSFSKPPKNGFIPPILFSFSPRVIQSSLVPCYWTTWRKKVSVPSFNISDTPWAEQSYCLFAY